MTKKCNRLRGERPKAFWGALVGGAMNLIGSAISSKSQARAIRRQIEAQKEAARTQLELANNSNLASTLNSYATATRSYNDEDDYNLKYRLGGNKRLGSNRIYITDGGNATKIGNDTYLLRGGSHEQTNETGQTGIGINVGGNEIEAEGGEVAQKKNGALRIFSAQPILGNGISPAQAILRGYNKDKVFSQQQAFKKRNGLKDDGSKATFGNLITMPFAGIAKNVIDYFSGTGKYTPKRVKVSNKTVNRKPIRNGQVGNFRVVNGKYFPNEKPLRQVYPEFDIISMGRGLPIKRSLKNTVGFVQKPNTFTRGIGNREGIKDLVESKVVRGNPVGTEMTAKAYTKATKSNRNNFNDIMNGTGIEGISHRYYNRSLSKEDFDAIRESYNKINASFKARHPKASGKIRFAIGDNVYDPLGNYKNYDDYLAQIASDRKTLRNATTINPDNGEPIAYFYDDGRNPLTQGHGYASSKWGVRISNPQDYNMKIFDGHLHYSNSKTIPFDSPNVEVFRSTPFGTIRYPKWMLRRGWYRNGGLTSKDRGSSKHPYPSVSSKDFAGGGRSYPIPTKADAVDALRLAGLHGRSDVKTKVYNKYPELRPKARIGGSWKAPVYNTNNYRVSSRMRRQIATWEGSDFVGQNRKFKGDAIGAKERELRRIMGRTYNYLNDNQRDSLNSIYYNSRVDTFKNAFVKWFRNLNSAVDRGDERAFNNSLAGIRQSMTIGENRKGMSGLAKRRAWERNWFGNPIPMDSNETKAILKQQAEARMVQPTDNTRVIIKPEYIEVPAPVGHGVIPVDNPDPNLLQGNIKDNLINMGNKFRLGQRCGGSTRMRKALGGESRPVKGMRRKLAWGDVTYPYTSQVSTPTSGVSENKTIPTYIDNKSGMIIRDADWYGLGADLVSSIGGSILGLGAYKNLDFDYNLPNFVEESPVALNTTYHNEAQKSNVERNRLNSRNSILRNTMSGSTAVGRMQGVDTNTLYQLNQLADEKTNKETELMNQNLLNEQQVRARNAAARNQYYNTVASIKNAAIQAKNEAELAKGQILSGSLQGIGNSFQNFISQGRQNYDDTQAMLMGVAASDYATPSRLLELGVDVGDDAALAGIYRSAMNIPNPGARPKREDYSDNTEYSYALTRWENQNKAYQRRNSYADLIKGRMSKKNLIKYGII